MDLDMAKVLLILSFIALGIAFLTVPSVQQFGRRLLTSSEQIIIPAGGSGSSGASLGDGDGDVSLDLVTLLGFDAIPAILDPEFITAIEADKQMDADEQVLGVSINGESRAYSIPMLSRHEIVNDVVGGVPIAVTW
jgi:hypothetical protein